ncbi:hypothetical protein BT96DRAFT_1005048 [Gymnopus androsaceus JB14]|uniref:Uncharacterized protein n=1 Tax=Gymnopus androsaceus JB14 TaxID=1447944 RepID=A0A6A4GP08_9AGAR|nr:hypothetical protein BT96DRAFT_1005048 [Gymnopus androsaceus JB14]
MAPKGKRKDAAAAASGPVEQTPNWPPFKPLISSSSLSLQEILPNQILTIPNFWPSSLSKTYVSFLSSLPLVTTPGKPKKGEALRVNDRFQIQDAAFAKQLWEETAMKDIVMGHIQSEDGIQLDEEARKQLWGGDVVGLNPNIRIYRRALPGHYSIYLTSPATGCVGGETVFYPEPSSKKAPPPEPIAIGFGECMLHEGREVLAGEKWVIRKRSLCEEIIRECFQDPIIRNTRTLALFLGSTIFV